MFHDGTRIRAIEWVDLGEGPRWAGPTEPDLDEREKWFRTGEYEEVSVQELPDALEELVYEARRR